MTEQPQALPTRALADRRSALVVARKAQVDDDHGDVVAQLRCPCSPIDASACAAIVVVRASRVTAAASASETTSHSPSLAMTTRRWPPGATTK